MYLIQPQQQSIESQRWRLLLVVSVHVVHVQNSSYHFKAVVTRRKFGLLAVEVFLELSDMPTGD